MSDKPPTIIRAPHGRDNPFVMIRRNALQEKSISWAARGLLAYLLSRPDNWEIQIKDLQQGCGRNKVYALLNELIQAHYVKRETDRDDKHHITRWYYQVYEIPYPDEPKNDLLPENLEVGKLEVGNGDTYIYESQQNTESTTDKKTLAPPENGAVTPDVEKPKKERSPAQQANDKLVEALGLAYGTEASNGEYGNYLRIAKQLTKDITPEEFPDFVAYVRNMAERDKWTFTVNSLVSGKLCPMSQFIKAGRPKAADTTPDFAKGINWI